MGDAAGQAGAGADLGDGRGGSPERRGAADGATATAPLGVVVRRRRRWRRWSSLRLASSRSRNGPRPAPSASRGPCCTTRPASSTATSVGPRDRGQPVGDERCPCGRRSSRSAARTTRRSVSGSMRAVASSSTTTWTSRTSSRAKATSCSSPADSVVPPGPSRVSRPSGRPATQAVEARAPRRPPRPVLARDVGEERDVLREGAGEDLGALGDHPDRRRSRWRSRSSTSTPPRNTVPRGGSTARETSEASVDLPEPVRPTRAIGLAGRHLQVDALQREGALGVGEVEVAQLDVEGPVGDGLPPTGSGSDGEHLAQSDDGAKPGLQVGQVVGQLAIWPTNVLVTRNSVTSRRDRRGAADASATPATARCRPAARAAARRRARDPRSRR